MQRETLLERIVDRLAASMTTGDTDHILLVGPRGSGKTCMVSLAAWELQKKEELIDVMRIAWLGEDDTFSGLIHLAFGIAKALADEYPSEFPADFKSDVRGLPQDDAALSVLSSVVKNLKHRQLLVITENLDQTFSGLGDSGQKKLRAFLQETRRFATLATSQQLFAAVSSRKESFFGFFDTHHLEPLDVEDATQLISNMAQEQGKLDLVQFLNSTDAKYRIRALHHLAGGNHRMYVLLAEFLTQDTLDDLVAAFEDLAEQMTPYFQERLRSLPDQQRQLVQCLCDAEGAMTVKEVAEETFIAEGNCSKQLGNLKAKGYVRSQKRGKESYYDMAEPLMRLCLEVKNQRGRPLQLVARFLRAWFPVEKLQQFASKLEGASRAAEYCQAALLTDNSFEHVINTNLAKEIRQKISAGRFDDAISFADELSVSDPLTALSYRAEAAWTSGDLVLAVTHLTGIIHTADVPAGAKAKALFNRGVTHGRMSDTDPAIADYTAVTTMPDAPAEHKALALLNRGVAYGQLGDTDAELADYTAVITMPDAPAEQKAIALNNRGVVCWRNEKWQASLNDFEAALTNPALPSKLRTSLLFAVPEPMVALRSQQDVLAALSTAFQKGDRDSNAYGGTPGDLLAMILRKGPSEWADYAAAISPMYVQHGVAEKLGQGITQSIQHLDEGRFSESQRDIWNGAWQTAGKDCDDLQIPLACLGAAVDVMKSDPPTDRPLFRLPLEIRQLVRPLLNNTLGPSKDS